MPCVARPKGRARRAISTNGEHALAVASNCKQLHARYGDVVANV